jgi:hypothetical protein
MTRLAVALLLAALMAHSSSTTLQTAPVARALSPVATPARDMRANDKATDVVEAEMRDVDFHIESGIVLHIARLRGALSPTVAGTPPTFDDKRSFTLVMHSAEIAIDTTSLAVLLNRHVFGYPGAPLRKLRLHTEGDQLVQSGVMHKGINMPFRIRATVSLTPDGRIRLHPTSVRVLGVGVTNVMDFLGVELANVIKLKGGRGASIDGNDFILDPEAILPPPQIRGHLARIAVGDGQIEQTFSARPGQDTRPLREPTASTPNYMYFRHGTLRFGKLTMVNADLLIVDQDPANIFDFSLDRYNDQLVAGYSKSTAALGLVVHMPDLRALDLKRLAATGHSAPAPVNRR